MWVENLRHSDLNQKIPNKAATKDPIPPEFLHVSDNVDSALVTPFRVGDSVCGVYSIEFDNSNTLTYRAKDLICGITKSLANIVWHAESYQTNRRMAATAISEFLDSIRDFRFPLQLSVNSINQRSSRVRLKILLLRLERS